MFAKSFFLNGHSHGRPDLCTAVSFNPPQWARAQTHACTATGTTEVGFLTHCITVGAPRVSFSLIQLLEAKAH